MRYYLTLLCPHFETPCVLHPQRISIWTGRISSAPCPPVLEAPTLDSQTQPPN